MLPVLKFLADGEEHPLRDARDHIAAEFSLSHEERQIRIPSGKQTVLASRVGWARTYMKKAGLLEYPRRGTLRITERGRELLQSNPASIDVKRLREYPEFLAFLETRREKAKTTDNGSIAASADDDATPEERLEQAFLQIRSDLEAEVLDAVCSGSPAFFERIVVELLVKMGYGGSLEDAGQVLGRSGDEGVDGVIKEDRLGLDVVYLQAKKWKTDSTVGRPEIQKFAGALQGHRAKKGVFITTASFTGEAREYASRIESRIVLIDGVELARLMVDFDLGVDVENIYEIKKIDSDYFDEES